MNTDLSNAIKAAHTAISDIETKLAAAAPTLTADAKTAATDANTALSKSTGPIRGWVMFAIVAAALALGFELGAHAHIGAITWE